MFLENTGGRGGALDTEHTLRISNSLVSRNVALDDGGGIRVEPGGTLDISSSLVTENSARNHGGGIRVEVRSTATVTAVTLRGNRATDDDQDDGGAAIQNEGSLTVTGSTLSGNTSAASGGGILNRGTLRVTNTTLANNVAAARGGGIVNGAILAASDAEWLNATISGNRSTFGGGVYNVSGTVRIQNTIVAGNSAASAGPDCRNLLTSLGDNVLGSTAGCSFIAAANDQVGGDARLGAFVDPGPPGLGRFPLLPGSAAVDRADDAACPLRDQLDLPRADIVGIGTAACDVGAVEFFPVINTSVAFAPRPETYDSTTDVEGCPAGFVGTFTFSARLTNRSSKAFTHVMAQVTTLTRGNLLQNAIGGPGGVGSLVEAPPNADYTDGMLGPWESVDIPFVVCLRDGNPFTLFVGVLGVAM
jgi:hypothetical protein